MKEKEKKDEVKLNTLMKVIREDNAKQIIKVNETVKDLLEVKTTLKKNAKGEVRKLE